MADIIQHPFSGNPAALLRLVPRHLLNPEPILQARRDRGGETATYDCPWCGGTHTHRLKPRRAALYSKASHCDVFNELFNSDYGTWFYVIGETSEIDAQAEFRRWHISRMQGELEFLLDAGAAQ